ncbi:MAG: sulfur carrier protein ThiS [Deltaproteobacteria bacterium]|nr:sulfur carrier protein ThiS [Deltaproteobacteria bacterium]
MNVVINGKEVTVPDGLTVTELMRVRDVPQMLVVELNGTILERRKCHTTLVEEDDQIEFIDRMGGG